jgi:hypothetical protein
VRGGSLSVDFDAPARGAVFEEQVNRMGRGSQGVIAAAPAAMLAGMTMVWYGNASDTLLTPFALHAGTGLIFVGSIDAIGAIVAVWRKLSRVSRS